MPTAFDELIAAADIETPDPDTGNTPTPTAAAETSASSTPTGTNPPAADPSTPAPTDNPPAAPIPEAPPATPATPNPDAEKSSRALIEETIAAHPELEAALMAKVRDLERGYQQKYQQLAALKKEAAEGVMRDEITAGIPVQHLSQLTQLYRMMEQGSAQQRQQAADYLFQLSEATRAAAAQTPPDPYANLDPRAQAELAQVREYVQQQRAEQLIAQVNQQFTALEGEFGTIPEDQRLQVIQAMQERGLQAITDIPMVYRGLFGWQHAQKQQKTAALQQQKAGLAPTTTPIAPPPAATSAKKDSLWDDIEAVCAEYGVK